METHEIPTIHRSFMLYRISRRFGDSRDAEEKFRRNRYERCDRKISQTKIRSRETRTAKAIGINFLHEKIIELIISVEPIDKYKSIYSNNKLPAGICFRNAFEEKKIRRQVSTEYVTFEKKVIAYCVPLR